VARRDNVAQLMKEVVDMPTLSLIDDAFGTRES
jgi:hypothetical protein